MFKLKDSYILRQVAGENIVLPSGDDLDLNAMITLNGTGAFLWQQLEAGATKQQLVDALLEEYQVDRVRAKASVDAFLAKLTEYELLA